MQLPNGNQAVIDLRKIIDYCLSTEHEDGRHKAHLFTSVLGLTVNEAEQLFNALRDVAVHGEAKLGRLDQYGQRYTIDFELSGPGGTAAIRSAWIIRSDEAVPRLVTCYIL